jgi:hypothetical protein
MSKVYNTEAEAREAAEAMSASMLETDDYIEFDGANCDDLDDNDCIGWDGNDRRCSCGNRRVSWSFDKLTKDSKWYFYAEAY